MQAPSPGLPQPAKHTPNAHPYAIKTTSTAVLTRSNSTNSNTSQGRHYYVPLASPLGSAGSSSSSRSRSGSRPGSRNSNGSAHGNGTRSRSGSEVESGEEGSAKGRDGYRGHRYSRSLGSDYTAAPYASAPSPVTGTALSRRSTVSDVPDAAVSASPWPDLPDSPKAWTPAQLAAYLAPHPAAAAWVAEHGLGGRAFVKIEEADLDP